jgi:hypothetical protein
MPKKVEINLSLNPAIFNLPEFVTKHFEELQQIEKQKNSERNARIYQENKSYYSQKCREKRANSKQYVIYDNTLGLLRTIIKSIKADKKCQSEIIEKYLGYTVAQFKNHFEKLFDKKMNWQNHGEYWHTDHIISDICFDYNSREDQGFKKSFALSNLRPLSKKDNLARPKNFKI